MERRDRANKTAYFNISEVARVVGVSPSTLRMWEKVGLIEPHRSDGKYRLFTLEDIKHLKRIKFLKSKKNLNASGVLHVLSQENSPRLTPVAKPAAASNRGDNRRRENPPLPPGTRPIIASEPDYDAVLSSIPPESKPQPSTGR